jgi:hypothetical protein
MLHPKHQMQAKIHLQILNECTFSWPFEDHKIEHDLHSSVKMLHAYYATNKSEVLKSQSFTDVSAGWKRQIELLRSLHPVLLVFYLQAEDKLGLQQHGHLCKPRQHVQPHTTGTERKQKRLHRITITFRELHWLSKPGAHPLVQYLHS